MKSQNSIYTFLKVLPETFQTFKDIKNSFFNYFIGNEKLFNLKTLIAKVQIWKVLRWVWNCQGWVYDRVRVNIEKISLDAECHI